MSEPLSDPPPDPLSGDPDCSFCGSLPRSYLARTGYGEYLPPAAGKLHGFEIDSGRDVRRCPVCDAFFDWEDIPQHYGSGNLDEERLDRLTVAQALAVKELWSPDFGGAAAEELVERSARLLPRELLFAILRHLVYHRPGFEPLVSPLIDLLMVEDEQPVVPLLLSWADKKRPRLWELVKQLKRGGQPLPRFGKVLLDLAQERLDQLPD